MGELEPSAIGQPQRCGAVWIVRVIDGRDPVPVEESRFADVDDNEWWMPYVERLVDLQITAGCTTDPVRFCPYETVTRGHIASFLVRAFRLQRAETARFTDTRGNVHETDIDALFAAGLTFGCDQRPLRYCPGSPVTRAQMASFLNRGLSGSTSLGTGGPTGPTGTPVAGTIVNSQGERSGDTQIAAVRGAAVRSAPTRPSPAGGRRRLPGAPERFGTRRRGRDQHQRPPV